MSRQSYLQKSRSSKQRSQSHRIVGVGRDLCGSSSATPLPKQGHLDDKLKHSKLLHGSALSEAQQLQFA